MTLKNLILVLLLMICVSCKKIVSDDRIHIYETTHDSWFESTENSQLFRESQELDMKGKYKEALEILLKLERREPRNKLILGCIGGSYNSLKHYDLSEKYYKKAIEVDSAFFNNWVNLSTLYISKKEFDLAYETLMKISDLEKTEEQNVFFILQLSIIKYHLGNCTEALFLCEDAKNMSDDEQLLTNAKNIYEEIKRNCIEK